MGIGVDAPGRLRSHDVDYQRCLGLGLSYADAAYSILERCGELYHDYARRSMEDHDPFTDERAYRIYGQLMTAHKLCWEAGDTLFRAASTAGARDGARMQRYWRDLGAFTLLLSIQDDEALQLYCDSVLGPIEQGDEEYGGELLRSLEAFIEQNGQWEKAARQVYCHRHTLRYRMRKVEELTGRDLSRAHDRIEFWLALRARELVR